MAGQSAATSSAPAGGGPATSLFFNVPHDVKRSIRWNCKIPPTQTDAFAHPIIMASSGEPPIVVLHNKYLSALHNDIKSAPRHLSNLRKLTIIGMPNTPVIKKQVRIAM
jgi:hypothetical protein